MRIIFVLRAVVLSGGIERVFVDKANWLASHGHDVLFLTYEQGIIDDGVTGLLSGNTPKDLSEKMEWMITHEAERQEMGHQAHQSAAKYQQDVVMKMWEKAYKEACENAYFY